MVQDLRLWKKPLDHPILYEECYKMQNYINPPKETDPMMAELGLETLYQDYYRGCHLFILVHGF